MARPKFGYVLKDGKTKVPGVTTILGRWKESGGLLQWAFKQGQEGAASLYEKRDEAADIGTYVHTMIEAFLMQAAPPKKPADLPDFSWLAACRAFEDFKRWESHWCDSITPLETPLVSERHKFGGTPDAEAAAQNGPAVVDWKTSGGIYPDTLIQVVAYRMLIEECTDLKMTGGFHILRLDKTSYGFSHRYVPADSPLVPIAERQFLRFLEAYQDDKVLKDFRA
jgi:hypothetical protein